MNSKKIILMALIFILFACVFSVTVYAEGEGGGGASVDTLITQMKNADISSGDGAGADNGIIKAINNILGLVQVAGTGVALIAVSLLGIKYMLASIEEKAEIKKYLIGAVIGGILVFGGTGIAKILASFSGTAFGGSSGEGGEG